MKKINLFSLLLMMFFSAHAFAVSSIKAEVNGMVCAFCAKGIEKKLNALPQGQGAFVDLKSRMVVLELKESQDISFEAFKKIIQEAGYSVSKIEKVTQSLEDIKASSGLSEKK
jgi:mercuric ion binding protein